MPDKGRKEYLSEATAKEIVAEQERRRKLALEMCSDAELQAELEKKPGYDGPRHVEK